MKPKDPLSLQLCDLWYIDHTSGLVATLNSRQVRLTGSDEKVNHSQSWVGRSVKVKRLDLRAVHSTGIVNNTDMKFSNN